MDQQGESFTKQAKRNHGICDANYKNGGNADNGGYKMLKLQLSNLLYSEVIVEGSLRICLSNISLFR